jgi:hypothetical protein
MCHKDSTKPYALPLSRQDVADGMQIMRYSMMLGKVTTKRNGEHVSSQGFTYPIGRTVYDQNAIVGDHGRALHFTASPDSTKYLQGNYGSHRLAVLPAPVIWDSPETHGLTKRCWHSFGAHSLLCLDCEGVELDVLTRPDFWQDLMLPDFTIPLEAVWHKQLLVGK